MLRKFEIDSKIQGYVFDESTKAALYKLANNNIIDSIDSPIASGKEAITFLGHLDKNPIVAKIYKVETSNFKNMDKYIKGDYRFRAVSKDRRDLFLLWANKEYKNLTLAIRNEVSVPIVIAKEKNILIMSFLGEGEIPQPQLTKAIFDYDVVYPQIIENYARLLYGAKIVHADFSAYNILINLETQKITIIDMGQAVVYSHPKSKEFLKRDIMNITDFLNKRFKKLNLTYEMVLEDLKKKKEEIYGRDN
ncbi:MAG: RIO1 family regulatory kinase/ATPase [archaeon]